MADFFEGVEGCWLLKGLNSKEKDHLAGSFTVKRISEGKVIFLESMPGESLYIIRSGAVRVSRVLSDGKEKTLVILGPEDMFGELALLDGGMRAVTVGVMENTELLSLGKHDFELFCDHHPKTAIKILKNILFSFVQKNREIRADDNIFLKWCFGEEGADGFKAS